MLVLKQSWTAEIKIVQWKNMLSRESYIAY